MTFLFKFYLIFLFSVRTSGSTTRAWASRHHPKASGTARPVLPRWREEKEESEIYFNVGKRWREEKKDSENYFNVEKRWHEEKEIYFNLEKILLIDIQ